MPPGGSAGEFRESLGRIGYDTLAGAANAAASSVAREAQERLGPEGVNQLLMGVEHLAELTFGRTRDGRRLGIAGRARALGGVVSRGAVVKFLATEGRHLDQSATDQPTVAEGEAGPAELTRGSPE